jgi:inner membrane protein
MRLGHAGRMNLPFPLAIPKSAARGFFLFLKIAGICVLILLLHIPLLMTRGILTERQGYQRAAAAEIAGIWGHEQSLTGPVLAVPYTVPTHVTRSKVIDGKVVNVDETEYSAATAYFFPEVLAVDGTVDPEVRHRGIYESVVYSSKLRLTGSFQPDLVAAGVEPARADWSKAVIRFGLSDLRGIRSISPFQVRDGDAAPFEASAVGAAPDFLPLTAKLPNGVKAGTKLEFSFDVVLQGSARLQIAPVGKDTSVALASSWSTPSFGGAYLPVKRTVGPAGFSAEWATTYLSRGFAQAWNSRTDPADLKQRIEQASFGVTFAQPLDSYRLADRAQKYGVLFFVLVFTAFFLFEVTAELRIHPLQYVLVGAALCLFFLGFLALSEFMSAGLAYGIAAAACTGLISLYTWTFLKTGRRTLVILGGLSATYGYLYFVLQSEDYALLAGTCALFAGLALVMFCTRRLNWYALGTAPESEAAAEVELR